MTIFRFLFCFVVVCTVNSISNNSPNILLLITDDQGNADASYNYQLHSTNKIPPILTPNLDYLASLSISFTSHYSQSMCSPTRVALLTSRYPHRLGNTFPSQQLHGELKPNINTFPKELQLRGYNTHFIGKWGIDNSNREYNNAIKKWLPSASFDNGYGPISRGFDTFYGLYNSFHHHFTKLVVDTPDWHYFNETHYLDSPGELDLEEDLSSTHIFTRETVKLINEYNSNTRNGPYFIQLSYTMPHDPLVVDDYYSEYESCKNIIAERRKIYCGMVQCVDESIGNITQLLNDLDLLDNTIIVFLSDNGGSPIVGGFNYPFKGGKGSNFEGGVRTPAFIYLPNSNSSGRIYDNIFSVMDWGPTLLNIIDEASENNIKTNFLKTVDGIDHSNALRELSNDNCLNNKIIPRKDLILDSNGWLNRSAYIVTSENGNRYKLLLGSQTVGLWDTYYEPTDSYIINKGQRHLGWVLANWLMDLLSLINKKLFLKEACIMLAFGAIGDIVDGVYDHTTPKHPLGTQLYGSEYRDFTYPYLNWTLFDELNIKYKNHYKNPIVSFFDLTNDKFELNNLVYSSNNRQQINVVYNKLLNTLIAENPPPDTNALFHEIKLNTDQFLSYFAIIFIIIVISTSVISYYSLKFIYYKFTRKLPIKQNKIALQKQNNSSEQIIQPEKEETKEDDSDITSNISMVLPAAFETPPVLALSKPKKENEKIIHQLFSNNCNGGSKKESYISKDLIRHLADKVDLNATRTR